MPKLVATLLEVLLEEWMEVTQLRKVLTMLLPEMM